MDIREIVASAKSDIDVGQWASGEMKRGLWPSRRAKAKAYRFGPSYSWRIITFKVDDRDCRVRILLNESKRICKVKLGVTSDGETLVLCEYEFHASEPGWHCHVRCDEIDTLDPTKTRFGSQRIPAAGTYHRRDEFVFKNQPITKVTAFNCACSFFGIKTQGALL